MNNPRTGTRRRSELQDPLDYAQTHHSSADTFDRVRKEDLQQGAQVLALWAYRVAQLPGMTLDSRSRRKTPDANELHPDRICE